MFALPTATPVKVGRPDMCSGGHTDGHIDGHQRQLRTLNTSMGELRGPEHRLHWKQWKGKGHHVAVHLHALLSCIWL